MAYSKMNRISRLGTYGILVHDSKILLTQKKSGPYKGLWDLPGGLFNLVKRQKRL